MPQPWLPRETMPTCVLPSPCAAVALHNLFSWLLKLTLSSMEICRNILPKQVLRAQLCSPLDLPASPIS